MIWNKFELVVYCYLMMNLLFVVLLLLHVIGSCLSLDSSDNPVIESRIVGGSNAFSGQFPFSAAITVHTNFFRYLCGGTLLNQQWILTAAQCVNGAVLFEIVLGSNDINNKGQHGLKLSTNDYFIHPQFNNESLENDIALIKLRLPLQYTDYVRPTAVLPVEELQEDKKVVAIGWGQQSDNSSELATTLKWTVLSSLSNLECKSTYGDQIKDKMVCVAGNYNEGPCIGDTGGPLVEIANAVLIHGVSSFFSWNGCESSDPSGYTRIYPYREWIVNLTSYTNLLI